LKILFACVLDLDCKSKQSCRIKKFGSHLILLLILILILILGRARVTGGGG
jgi:hypothetical protein